MDNLQHRLFALEVIRGNSFIEQEPQPLPNETVQQLQQMLNQAAQNTGFMPRVGAWPSLNDPVNRYPTTWYGLAELAYQVWYDLVHNLNQNAGGRPTSEELLGQFFFIIDLTTARG